MVQLYTGYCNICKKQITSKKAWIKHLKTKSHKLKSKNKNRKKSKIKRKLNLYTCNTCAIRK